MFSQFQTRFSPLSSDFSKSLQQFKIFLLVKIHQKHAFFTKFIVRRFLSYDDKLNDFVCTSRRVSSLLDSSGRGKDEFFASFSEPATLLLRKSTVGQIQKIEQNSFNLNHFVHYNKTSPVNILFRVFESTEIFQRNIYVRFYKFPTN